jgi:hypothetical protein
MSAWAGFDPVIVFDWLAEHATKREDGRFVTLRRQLIDDSHRDTFARWENFAALDPEYRVPLARWDEILVFYGVMLSEFEDWAQEIYGTSGYRASSDEDALEEAA